MSAMTEAAPATAVVVREPATGEVIGELPVDGRDDVAAWVGDIHGVSRTALPCPQDEPGVSPGPTQARRCGHRAGFERSGGRR